MKEAINLVRLKERRETEYLQLITMLKEKIGALKKENEKLRATIGGSVRFDPRVGANGSHSCQTFINPPILNTSGQLGKYNCNTKDSM